MAEDNDTERTEDPTQKRLDDAHAKGDVAKSQEVNTWFVIAGATLVLSTFSGAMGGGILVPMRNLIANSWMIRTDGHGLLELARHIEYALIASQRDGGRQRSGRIQDLASCFQRIDHHVEKWIDHDHRAD